MNGGRCWLCHGYELVDRRTTGETSWSAATGGEHGERFTVYSLHLAPSIFEGELIACPVCKPRARVPETVNKIDTKRYPAHELQAALERTYGLLDHIEARLQAGDVTGAQRAISEWWERENRIAEQPLLLPGEAP